MSTRPTLGSRQPENPDGIETRQPLKSITCNVETARKPTELTRLTDVMGHNQKIDGIETCVVASGIEVRSNSQKIPDGIETWSRRTSQEQFQGRDSQKIHDGIETGIGRRPKEEIGGVKQPENPRQIGTGSRSVARPLKYVETARKSHDESKQQTDQDLGFEGACRDSQNPARD